MTGGRTRSDGVDLTLETQVVTRPEARTDHLNFEQAEIVEVGKTAISIAEIASHIDVAVGVARVLVSDLVSEGVLTANPTETPADQSEMLRRLMKGIAEL